ncbi:hypothetical protein F5141DRAFT_1065066 [Pisolithus sp. B1]|nr:hypothetical protein F5141DRAFT_1065066 [Pisolithus sp. B1]
MKFSCAMEIIVMLSTTEIGNSVAVEGNLRCEGGGSTSPLPSLRDGGSEWMVRQPSVSGTHGMLLRKQTYDGRAHVVNVNTTKRRDRFHPYARVKPSARELVMAALYASDQQDFIPSYQTVVPDANPSSIVPQNLHDAVNVTHSVDTPKRKLSMSSLVVGLALLMCRKPPPTA